MVQATHSWRASRYPQEDDRGTGSQVAGCLMEVCHPRRSARRRHSEPCNMILNNRTPQFIGRVRMASDPTMKIPRWWQPDSKPWHKCRSEEWAHHSGAKPLDAYGCIMVPIQDWIDRIQGCDSRDVTRFTAPRTFLKLRKRHALKNAVDKKNHTR